MSDFFNNVHRITRIRGSKLPLILYRFTMYCKSKSSDVFFHARGITNLSTMSVSTLLCLCPSENGFVKQSFVNNFYSKVRGLCSLLGGIEILESLYNVGDARVRVVVIEWTRIVMKDRHSSNPHIITST